MNKMQTQTVKTAKRAAFACITARSQVYKNYPEVSTDIRDKTYPMLLMMHRWDGRLGFYGGFIEENESARQCAIREIEQEANLFLVEEKLEPLCSHMVYTPPLGDALAVETFHYDLGNLSLNEMKILMKKMADAPHSIVEGTPIWVHLSQFADGWGFPVTSSSSNLAPSVNESLKFLTKKLNVS